VRRVETTEALTSALIVQEDAQQAAADRQIHPAVIFDKAKLPELVHEMTDPRPGGAYYFRKGLLIDPGDHPLLLAMLANTCK